jgi:hypothetical protein
VSSTASQRPKKVLIVLFVLGIVAVVGFAGWRLLGGDDSTEPRASATEATASATPGPTTESTATTTPTPTVTASCEGDDTLFNVEGTKQDSLLPDCGVAAPVTREQQQEKGLGLACGGTYPVILYKTTTSDAKTSICGKDASGESFRFVTQAGDGEPLDMPGRYDYQRDAFVASKSGTSYSVLAYNGTLVVKKDGVTDTQDSSDWISLDNESDVD